MQRGKNNMSCATLFCLLLLPLSVVYKDSGKLRMPWCPSDVSNSILTCFHSSFRTSDSHSSLVACCLFRSFMFRDTIILSNSQFKEGREDLEELGRETERQRGWGGGGGVFAAFGKLSCSVCVRFHLFQRFLE